ncbi:Hypothetical predicted protein [Podarcis lilfordi]|uniref:Uncharacterized protein n=1 Tax=Podarcis lilfordi TaxID=74358 RepID=A0AA35KDW6_9SAUR|nr:Hypothetical predicted protein [Podarcis lilfordi]
MRTARWRRSLRLACSRRGCPSLPSARQALDPVGGEEEEEKEEEEEEEPASLQQQQQQQQPAAASRSLQCSGGAAPSPAHGDFGSEALLCPPGRERDAIGAQRHQRRQ